ncbi:MAG: glycosyltransferase [Tissierellia bacterium]|nr:glycosyltransferase [Tissierellia bacterium]
MNKKKILYINRAGIPTNAPGIRIYNLAKILREIGYKVDFICDRENDIFRETLKTFDGFNYFYNTKNSTQNSWQSLKNIYELIFARRIFNRVQQYCVKDKPFAIILYNDVYFLTKQLIKYCKANNIRLIADVTEWYGKSDSKNIGDKIVPYLTDKRIKRLDHKVKNIISISSYLNNYYLNLGCNSIFVPPVFDMPKNIVIKKFNYYSHYVLNLVYAGSPGNKDILNQILDAVAAINKNKIRIRLDIVGLDRHYLKDSWKNINFDNIAIIAHGRLPHSDTLDIIRKADFGVLLRKNERYAKAGFSTKFAECMANGVAMICNSVGGADSLMTHLHDGMIIEGIDHQQIVEILTKALSLTVDELYNIKNNAFITAKKHFDRSDYCNLLAAFLKEG